MENEKCTEKYTTERSLVFECSLAAKLAASWDPVLYVLHIFHGGAKACEMDFTVLPSIVLSSVKNY